MYSCRCCALTFRDAHTHVPIIIIIIIIIIIVINKAHAATIHPVPYTQVRKGRGEGERTMES